MDKKYLKDLVDEGLSIRDISSASGKAPTTVRHWLKKYGLKTLNIKVAHKKKIEVSHKKCPRCGAIKSSEEFYRRRSSLEFSPYCKPCTSSQTLERQREFKKNCVEYLGGSCQNCGYSAYIGALEFHHLNPFEKEFTLSKRKSLTFGEDVKRELSKCVLLCANCHREEHFKLSAGVPERPSKP